MLFAFTVDLWITRALRKCSRVPRCTVSRHTTLNSERHSTYLHMFRFESSSCCNGQHDMVALTSMKPSAGEKRHPSTKPAAQPSTTPISQPWVTVRTCPSAVIALPFSSRNNCSSSISICNRSVDRSGEPLQMTRENSGLGKMLSFAKINRCG